MMQVGGYQKGFTIVELLIVVVVIAILAAITIVSYNGIQTRATAVQYENNAQSIAKKAEIFYQQGDRYPLSTASIEIDGASVSSLPGSLNIAFTTVGTGSMTNRVCSATTDPSGIGTYACSIYKNSNTGRLTYIARECPFSTDIPTTSTGTGLRLFYANPLNTDIFGEKSITLGAGCS